MEVSVLERCPSYGMSVLRGFTVFNFWGNNKWNNNRAWSSVLRYLTHLYKCMTTQMQEPWNKNIMKKTYQFFTHIYKNTYSFFDVYVPFSKNSIFQILIINIVLHRQLSSRQNSEVFLSAIKSLGFAYLKRLLVEEGLSYRQMIRAKSLLCQKNI